MKLLFVPAAVLTIIYIQMSKKDGQWLSNMIACSSLFLFFTTLLLMSQSPPEIRQAACAAGASVFLYFLSKKLE